MFPSFHSLPDDTSCASEMTQTMCWQAVPPPLQKTPGEGRAPGGRGKLEADCPHPNSEARKSRSANRQPSDPVGQREPTLPGSWGLDSWPGTAAWAKLGWGVEGKVPGPLVFPCLMEGEGQATEQRERKASAWASLLLLPAPFESLQFPQLHTGSLLFSGHANNQQSSILLVKWELNFHFTHLR